MKTIYDVFKQQVTAHPARHALRNDDASATSLTDIPVSRYVDDFVQLVSDHFREEHGTEFYADRLCITSNYLNKIVRQSLGKSAKTYILDQILAEACRQLKYTTLPVANIAVQLHFDTATYFVRLFKKHMAMTPLEYRENG